MTWCSPSRRSLRSLSQTPNRTCRLVAQHVARIGLEVRISCLTILFDQFGADDIRVVARPRTIKSRWSRMNQSRRFWTFR